MFCLSKANTCTYKHEKGADIGHATATDISNSPPNRGGQTLQDHVGGYGEIYEFGCGVKIQGDCRNGREVDV